MGRWIVLVVLAGCGQGELDTDLDGGAHASMDASSFLDAGPIPRQLTLGGDRPAGLLVPRDYDGAPLPLVVLLHGYSVDAAAEDAYLRLSSRVDERGFFLLLPNGTRERSTAMYRFWNATDACCDFYGSNVDDVAHLSGLIDEARSLLAISAVHLVGHSNGGFMAHRMACETPERIDSIVSLAGATYFVEDDCGANAPMRVLQIHGTSDTTVLYEGVSSGEMRYPGAEETVLRWATRAGCDLDVVTPGMDLDVDLAIAGRETEVEIYRSGCATGIDVDLWRINGGGHFPMLGPDFVDRVLDWSFGAVEP